MVRQIEHLIIVVAMAASTFCVPGANAFNEGLTIEQSAGGSITATVSGLLYPCSYGFAGEPSVTISAGEILIVSHAVAMGCPILLVAEPVPFAQKASLGVLANGAYTVSWTQTDVSPTFQVQRQFSVAAGFLVAPSPAPIPALSPWCLVLSVLLVGCLGSACRRRL